MARTSKGFCADSRASSGQNKGNTKTFQGLIDRNLKRAYEDKHSTGLGQAKDNRGLANVKLVTHQLKGRERLKI